MQSVGSAAASCYNKESLFSAKAGFRHYPMSSCQTIVVKLGTSVLTGGSRKLNRAHMVE
ncbi:MAG: glutamate 5-kinase, partial [Plesiomonas shigelloides]